jgi:hypothetical protein
MRPATMEPGAKRRHSDRHAGPVEATGSDRIDPQVNEAMNVARPAVSLLAAWLIAASVNAQPAPPPPPLPPEGAPGTGQPFGGEPSTEPQVTIIRRDSETREEVRINGELKFVRVTPLHGRVYYLVPQNAGGGGTQFIRRDSLDASISVPQWMLLSW